MSQPVLKPCFVGGTVRASGDMQDNSIQTTTAGNRVVTFNSGLTAAAIVFSGPGRLNSILQITSIVSGTGVLFYDSAVPTSGGVLLGSGHKVVGILPPAWNVAASGQAATGWMGTPITVGLPFQSGLCASPLASGCNAFSVSITPQVSSEFPNP